MLYFNAFVTVESMPNQLRSFAAWGAFPTANKEISNE
jgi:hypothetical protein